MYTDFEKNLYFQWLCSHIEARPGSSAEKTASVLHSLPFTPQVALDENRYEDGLSLRHEYNFESAIEGGQDWGDCSFLEMLIGLSERMGLQIDMSTSTCFWHLMKNLGNFRKFTNPDTSALREAVNRINNRTFEVDGIGGLFPLKEPMTDQREEQLYRQMQLYILEIDL